jgi:hypothetical protein
MGNSSKVKPANIATPNRGSLAGVTVKQDGQYLKLPDGCVPVWNYFEDAAKYASTLAGKVEVVSVYV